MTLAPFPFPHDALAKISSREVSILAEAFVAMVEGRNKPATGRRTVMTQYLLAVHHDEQPALSPDEMEQSFKDVEAVNSELQAAGAWVFAGGLHPPSTATVVRVNDGTMVTTDGPFAETKEQLGGFWVIQAADLDAALAWAAKATVACRLPVEVRPFQEG
jgi:hypothetical protein